MLHEKRVMWINCAFIIASLMVCKILNMKLEA